MSIRKLLDTAPLYDVVLSKSSKDYKNLCVAFSGAPRKHPYDHKKMLLFSSPFSSHTKIYEFKLDDIGHIEELPSIATEDGENLNTIRLWVYKGSLGIHYEPFEVQDEPIFYEDSELLHQVMNEQE